MDFTIQFVLILGTALFQAIPLLSFLILLIIVLGLWIGKTEGWSRSDSIYFAFITATTVGYGDFRPQHTSGKYKAILIALVGLIMTGIIVAIGVKAAEVAFKTLHDVTEIIQ